MKRSFLVLDVLFLSVVLLVFTFIHFGVDLTDGITGATIAAGGNVTNLNITLNATATRWAGIYGQITVNTSLKTNTTISLSGGQISMRNITLPCSGDKLYATTASTVDWSGLVAGTPQLVDTYLNISLPDAESSTEMFVRNKTFNVNGKEFNLPTTDTLVFNSKNISFDLAVLNSINTPLLVTHLLWDQVGFNGEIHDYQMLLPISGLKETYRLFSVCEDITSPGITIVSPSTTLSTYSLSMLLNVTVTEPSIITYNMNNKKNYTLCDQCTRAETPLAAHQWGNNIITIFAQDPSGNMNSTNITFNLISDLDKDGIPDVDDLDKDNDGVIDTEDLILGNLSSFTSTNFGGLINFTVGESSNLSQGFTGIQTMKFSNNTNTFLEFNFDFDNSETPLSLGNIVFEKQDSTSLFGSALVRGLSLPPGFKKTLYLDNLDEARNSICIKDADITDISEVSGTCSGSDETLILCTTEGTTKNGYVCSSLGKMLKVTGATHTGIIEFSDESSVEASPISGGGSGSNGNGGNSCPLQMVLSKGSCVLSSPVTLPSSGIGCTAGFARIGGICLKQQSAKPFEGELSFNLTISLPAEKKNVTNTEKTLPLNVILTKLNNQWIPTDFVMYYTIKNSVGKIVVEDTGTITVEAESSFVKNLNITALSLGEQTISAYAIIGERYADDHTNFTIYQEKKNLAGFAGYILDKTFTRTIQFNWLVVLLIILLLRRGFGKDLFDRR